MTEQPGTPGDPAIRASDTDRERVVQILYRAAGENRLTLDETQDRIDVVYAAKTVGELNVVLTDLPAELAEPAPGGTVARLDPRIGGRPGSRLSLGLVSFAQRRGGWVVPRQHVTVAVYGRAELDLRDARFAERECVVNAFALLGGVEIIVPEDVTVSIGGLALLGRFGGTESQGPAGGPVVRIRGGALFGSVLVTRRPADEKPPTASPPLPELER